MAIFLDLWYDGISERPANKAWKSDDRGKIARDTYWTMFGERTAQITPDEPIAPYPRPTGLVKIGMKGDSVRWVQYALNVHLGYDIGESGIDGDFGDATETAVATFQVEHGLTPYGYVDEETRNLIVEKVQEILSNNNPVGYLDSATGGEKCVTVTGWAYDADTPEESCEIHIYMDGPAGQGICVATGIIANLPSPDVNEILGYPGNHRYEATVSIDAVGEHTFYAHAINRGGGNENSLLEQSFSTTINDISQDPLVIEDMWINEVSDIGYTAWCKVNKTDIVSKVLFPTWTGDAQDDTIWYEGTYFGDNQYYCYVRTNEHNDEKNTYYHTHVYAYDNKRNYDSQIVGDIYIDNSSIEYGDANEDGKVSISDAVAILQYLANAEKYPLSEQGKLNADVDGTAGVSGKDAAAIQQYDAGMVNELPLNK